MLPRPALGAFLGSARAALTATGCRTNPLTFVVGNESADLDSLCSAVVYAYLRSTTHHPASPTAATAQQTLHIPLANLARADLALRPELTAALAHAHLKPSDLITIDDLPSNLEPAATRWLLVDHNAMTGTLLERGFGSRVVGCVDHHADEGKVVASENPEEPRIIVKTGSCASLVVDHVRRAWEDATRGASQGANASETEDGDGDVDTHVARLALAPILVDTANLKAEDRTTEKDVAAARFLEDVLFLSGGPGTGYRRDEYFEELSSRKEDLGEMGLRDVLRKDYKQWEEAGTVLGFSSVPKGLGHLLDDKAGGDADALLDAFRSWATEKGLDVGVIMTTLVPGGEFQRELFVWVFSDRAVPGVEEFVSSNGGELGLGAWRGGELDSTDGGDKGGWRRAWKQGNIGHSRKKVGPMMREAMQRQARL